jgi:inosose dehydratase
MSLIATSSYSFHGLVQSGEATILDAPRLAAEAGAEAIEFALGPPFTRPPDAPLARALRDAAERAGLPVCSVVVSAELLRGGGAERRQAVESVRSQLDAAHAMGARRFRHDATLGPESGDLSDRAFDEALPVLADACRTIARRAAELDMLSSIENHGRFVQHADRVRRLVEAVDHDAFRVTLDIGNSLFAPQDHVVAARTLAPFAITVHVKDFIIGPESHTGSWETYPGGPRVLACALGEGDVKIAECLQPILSGGFDGPIVVEFEGPHGDPREAVVRGLRFVRTYTGSCPPP